MLKKRKGSHALQRMPHATLPCTMMRKDRVALSPPFCKCRGREQKKRGYQSEKKKKEKAKKERKRREKEEK
jgi:hypothetical protein